MKEVLVLYYSHGGAVGEMATFIARGIESIPGVKARIREKLLKECNLHTIIRLPQSTFSPATVSTNLLFFEKPDF